MIQKQPAYQPEKPKTQSYHSKNQKVKKYQRMPYEFKYEVPSGKYSHQEISDEKSTRGGYKIERPGFKSQTSYKIEHGSGFASETSYSTFS